MSEGLLPDGSIGVSFIAFQPFFQYCSLLKTKMLKDTSC